MRQVDKFLSLCSGGVSALLEPCGRVEDGVITKGSNRRSSEEGSPSSVEDGGVARHGLLVRDRALHRLAAARDELDEALVVEELLLLRGRVLGLGLGVGLGLRVGC